ncbi:putative transposase [Brucella grignonensis]|uniref:Putative transposase n=1 Tax=Brucella grignonensis TaxID=94627 RepID=A0A256F0S3_9HYPH|nr:putative transposase [Brucella grignonensis]
MIRFKSARQCQRFVLIYGPITNLFHLQRNKTTTEEHRKLRNVAVNTWHEIMLSIAA